MAKDTDGRRAHPGGDPAAALGRVPAGRDPLQFWLNILLTLLGYIPGIIHAVYIIVKR